MPTVDYSRPSSRTRTVLRPRRTRRDARRLPECEPLEDRRLLSASSLSSITFTFNFNFNQIANSIPSIVQFNFSVPSSTPAASQSGLSGAASAGTQNQSPVATTSPITPISPSIFSASPATGEEPIIYIFFTPQTAVHLGTSSAPATTQRTMAQSIEQPIATTTGNLFGQSLFDTVSGMADPTLVPASSSPETSLIDVIDPLVPAAAPKLQEIQTPHQKDNNDAAPKPPRAAPELQLNPMPDAKPAELPNLDLDNALGLMVAAPDLGPTPQDQALASASDSTPRFVGAAAIAVGGYALIMGQSDRFRDGRFRTLTRRRFSTGARFMPSVN